MSAAAVFLSFWTNAHHEIRMHLISPNTFGAKSINYSVNKLNLLSSQTINTLINRPVDAYTWFPETKQVI